MNQQEVINDFFREYVDRSFKTCEGHIKPSKEHTREHFLYICEVCYLLKKMNIPFFTEVRLKCGLIPDIIIPTHLKKIIEIMHTEDINKFMKEKYPKVPRELRDSYIFIETSHPLNEEMLL